MTNQSFRSAFVTKFIIYSLIIFSQLPSISAQNYKKMTPDAYSLWNRIKNIKLSDSAETIIYTLEREIGDKILCIYNKKNNFTHTYPRVSKAETDPTGRYVIFLHGLSYDSTRTLQRKKTPKDKMPEDSLSIVDVYTLIRHTIPKVSAFTIPEKFAGYCIYNKKPEHSVSDTAVVKDKKRKNICDDDAIIIRKLFSGKEDTIRNAKDFAVAELNPVITYSRCFGDSISRYSVYVKNMANDSTVLIKSDLYEVAGISLDKTGNKTAFLGLDNKSKAAQKPYAIYLKTEDNITAVNISNLNPAFIPEGWVISSDNKITWSDSGNRMFFGAAPIRPVRDTLKLDDDVVQVEIWHHDSPRLYTQMKINLENDKKKSYQVMYRIPSQSFDLLETPEVDKCILSKKGDGRYVLQLRSQAYQKAVTWLGEAYNDFILYDTETSISNLITIGESGSPAFSPEGRFIYWWSRNDSIWKTYDTEKASLSILGLWSITKFHDEQNDIPQAAAPYGIAGWVKGDNGVIVYDRYDMWLLNPQDAFSNINITDGRLSQTVHRYIHLDKDIEYIDPEKFMLIHRFNERTKAEGYISHYLNQGTGRILTGGDFAFTKNVIKAPKSNDFIFTKQNFNVFPDLLLTDTTFANVKKISDANPQQKNYGWGSARLFSWTNYRGQKNDGMIFYPPNFDPENKYPLIVNFYERSSDDLNRHRAPEAHRSSINYTYYTNLGYIIFNPDITYLTGQPGDDCVNAVESGVDALVKEGYIDQSVIGLQGHSWGGYQVAYLLTKSERYKCAESGAPVVNMVSAYGGIRWESGMSRMFQYEKTQSRLGASLWENPALYHKNSPIYEMTKVNAPVLILHNDNDGAVPWQQGIEYFMALRRLGKPAWLLNYNDEPHWPVKWPNRLDFNIRMEQFFNHYLMGGPLPLWMREGNTPFEKGILDKY